MREWIVLQLEQWHISGPLAETAAAGVILVLVSLLALLVHLLVRGRLLAAIGRLTERTSNQWDDVLMRKRVFHRLLRLLPLTIIRVGLDYLLPGELLLVKRIVFAAIIFTGARAAEAALDAVGDLYNITRNERRRPIRPLIQALIIALYLFTSIAVIAVLLDKSPWNLFTLLGGLTAVTMLVFKDTILGFVAGIQLGAYDMVREGDWIEMPRYGADGDVIEITVNTVKVRNWDKTISTIPTYALISDSFKNWRGMTESGGRRIKRSIHIDMTTVRFVDEAMLERFRRVQILRDYIEHKQKEIEEDNRRRGVDLSATVINGRRQTNLGIFRAYLLEYLRRHPLINQDMTLIVRHLQPTPQGLPIEIYVFSREKKWADYEAVQADIFDHILAAIPEFELRVFQEPSGWDLSRWSREAKAAAVQSAEM